MNNYIGTFTSLSSDTVILLILFSVILFISIRQGKSYIASAILSVYIASFFYTNLPFTKSLMNVVKGTSSIFWNHLAVFLLLFIPTYFILNKVVVADFGKGPFRFILAGASSLAFLGLIMSIFYHIIPLEPIYNFSPAIDNLFETDIAYTFWILAPLLVLFF